MADERLRTLIDEELKTLGIQQGHSTKTIEEMNSEFVKKHSNSLAHRAEGKETRIPPCLSHEMLSASGQSDALIESIGQPESRRVPHHVELEFHRSKSKGSALSSLLSSSALIVRPSFRHAQPSMKTCKEMIMGRSKAPF